MKAAWNYCKKIRINVPSLQLVVEYTFVLTEDEKIIFLKMKGWKKLKEVTNKIKRSDEGLYFQVVISWRIQESVSLDG